MKPDWDDELFHDNDDLPLWVMSILVVLVVGTIYWMTK